MCHTLFTTLRRVRTIWPVVADDMYSSGYALNDCDASGGVDSRASKR